MRNRLQGRVAVVTGAGRGIGRAIALRLAGEGAAVVVSSRTAPELDQVVGEIGRLGATGLAVVANATVRDEARRPVIAALDRFGRIDILVNNVGGAAGPHGAFEGGDEAFEATLVLSLTSAWWATTAALPAMRDAGYGRVVNIGSNESERAGSSIGYVAAKHGLAGLTRQIAQDVGPTGITVNCVCPGWTQTSMVDWDRLGLRWGVTPAEAHARAAAACAQNLVLEPDDIAAMVLFLAGPDGARITGQIINVDGGYHL